MITIIDEIVGKLYRNNEISFNTAIAIAEAVKSWKPTEQEIKSCGTLSIEALKDLRKKI